METAERLRRAISKDKSESRVRSGSGPLFVVPSAQVATVRIAKDSFASQLDEFENKLSSLSRTRNLSIASYADQICLVLRQLLRNVTGSLGVSDAIAILSSDYWAESAIVRLVEDVERDALATIQAPNSNSGRLGEFIPHEQIRRLRLLSEWLRKRHATLCFLEERGVVEAGGVAIRSVLHDRERLGVKGFEVTVSARLDGFEHQSLWLKLQIFAFGEPVLVHPDWKFWQEDAEAYSLTRRDDHQEENTRFTTMVPIISQHQRLMVDAVTIFVPYAALDLVSLKRTEVEIEVQLVTEAAALLSADALTDYCALSPRNNKGEPIPSPLSLGFWSHNVGSGEKIERLSITPVSNVVASREAYLLTVSADIELYGRESETVMIEVRFLTRAGHFIESDLDGYRAPDGTFCYAYAIRPESVCSRFSPLQLSVPLIALELDPGRWDIFAEVTLLDRSGSIICGDLAAVELTMPDTFNADNRILPTIPDRSPDEVMVLKALVVDSHHSFSGRDVVRIEALLADLAVHQEVCQLRLKIIPNETHHGQKQEPIVRGLVIERGARHTDQTFVFIIDAEDFMPMFPPTNLASSFSAVIEVVDRRGVVKLAGRRTFSLPANFGSQCSTWLECSYAGQGVEIIDAQSCYSPLRGGEVIIDLVINSDYSASCEKAYPIYFEPLLQVANARGQIHEKVEGCVVEIPLTAPSQSALSSAPGERQMRHQVRLPKAFQTHRYSALKLMLFSPEGRVLQVLYVSLQQNKQGTHSERLIPAGSECDNADSES